MLTYVCYTKIVNLCHGKAFRRAHCSTQSAETALPHIDIKFGCPDTFGSAIRSFSYFFNSLNRFDGDAIYGADLGALVANNAVVYLIVKPVPSVVRDRQYFMRILNRSNPFLLRKIIFVGYWQS